MAKESNKAWSANGMRQSICNRDGSDNNRRVIATGEASHRARVSSAEQNLCSRVKAS